MAKRPGIIIIEDQPIMRNALAAQFKKSRRWNVIGAVLHLDEAKQLLLKHTPDIILLDIQLSDDDWGLDIIPWLVKKGCYPMPVIAVYSVFEDYAHVSAALGMGVKSYITKRRDEVFLEEVLLRTLEGETYIDDVAQSKINTVNNFLKLLSKRELEIFSYVKRGISNKQIAKQAGISIRTIENILHCIYDKTETKSRSELEKL